MMVACTADGGIGKDGKIPWYCSKDLKYFQKITTTCSTEGKQNAVIMGRRTWESLPKRPLNNRKNIVLTRSNASTVKGADAVFGSLQEALKMAHEDESVERVFVIGGGEVFFEAIVRPECERVYMTTLDLELNGPCDTFFPIIEMLRRFELVKAVVDGECTFQEFSRIGAHHTTST